MIKLNKDIVKDKIYACWIGKNIGGTMGTPYEGRTELLDIQGFSTPEGVVLANDDLDLQLVWLRAMEEVGPYSLNEQILGEYWVSYIPPHWNEYGICKNNMHIGLIPPLAGEYKNVWKHSNGAWIRTEVWACMAPGCPDIAMKYARMDASVDHGMGEGTYAAMLVAAMEAAAFVVSDLYTLIEIGLSKIPEESMVAKTIRLLLACKAEGKDWKTARNEIVDFTKELGWFQAPANVAFSLLGMLYGEGDFKKSMILAINCGDDTDCTGATLGALFGILNGTVGIPADWRAHLGDSIVSVAIDRGSCYGLPTTCTELTEHVYAMIPVTYMANRANACLADEDEIAEEDVARFYDKAMARHLLDVPGNSYSVDMIWGSARVIFPDGPDAKPGVPTKVQIKFINKHNPAPKHMELTWHLPDGWQVVGAERNYLLPTDTRYSPNYVIVECEIVPSENVKMTNRVILEVVSPGRPTAGLIPIVLIG